MRCAIVICSGILLCGTLLLYIYNRSKSKDGALEELQWDNWRDALFSFSFGTAAFLLWGHFKYQDRLLSFACILGNVSSAVFAVSIYQFCR